MGKEKKKIKISCTSKVTIIICIAAFILYIVSNHCKNSIIITTTLIISKKPGNTGISRDIRTEFTTDLLLSD